MYIYNYSNAEFKGLDGNNAVTYLYNFSYSHFLPASNSIAETLGEMKNIKIK